MAGADASIYSMIRPMPAQQGPLEQTAALMQLRAMGDASQLHGLQRQKLEQDFAEDAALKSSLANWVPGADVPVEAFRAAPTKATALQKGQIDNRKSTAELLAKDRENFIALADQERKRLPTITPELWGAYRDEQIKMAGMFATPEMRRMAQQAAMAMPAQFDPNYVRNSLIKAEELFTPKPTEIDQGGKKIIVDMNPWTNPAILKSEFAKTLTPGEQQTGAHQNATLAETQRHHRATEAHQAATQGVPAGYRRTADGQGLERIPGGPADDLTTTQKDELTSIARTQASAARLKTMFKPEYVGFQGSMGELMDKYGSQVVPFVDGDQGRIQFRALAADLENQYIKAISGATVPTSEVPRLRRAIPTPSDSPAQYQAKLEEMEKNLTELPGIIRNGAKAAPAGSNPPPAPKQDAPKAAPKTFDAMPDPAQYKGRRIRGDDGTIYTSDGKSWKRG